MHANERDDFSQAIPFSLFSWIALAGCSHPVLAARAPSHLGGGPVVLAVSPRHVGSRSCSSMPGRLRRFSLNTTWAVAWGVGGFPKLREIFYLEFRVIALLRLLSQKCVKQFPETKILEFLEKMFFWNFRKFQKKVFSGIKLP